MTPSNNGTATIIKAPLTLPAGFATVRPQPRRIIAAIRGNAKEGKTTLALDFPEPILIFNFDYGYEAAARYILEKNPAKKMFHFDMPVSDTTTADELVGIVKKFQTLYEDAVRYADQERGTVVVDTASDLWRIVGESVIGPLREKGGKNPAQYAWGKANIIMAGILRKPFQYDNVNAVFVHRNKPIYVQDPGGSGFVDSGRTEGQWFGDTPAVVEHIFDIYEDQKDKKYKAHIEVCRTDRMLRGLTVMEPTYAKLWAMVGPPEEDEGKVLTTSTILTISNNFTEDAGKGGEDDGS